MTSSERLVIKAGSPARSAFRFPGRAAQRGMLAGAILGVLMVSAVMLRSGDPTSLMHVGGQYVVPADVPEPVAVLPPNQGYDGQFFYRQSVDPFSNAPVLVGVRFDAPGLRAARVVYPLAAHLLARGRPEMTPWTMIAVNLLAFAALGALAASFAERVGRRWWQGFALLAIPGITIGLAFDTADVVGLTCVMAAAWAFHRRSTPWFALALLAGLLTRESTAVVALGYGIAALVMWARGDRRRGAVTLGAILCAGAAWLAWQGWVFHRFGETGVGTSGGENLAMPFSSLWRQRGFFEARPTSPSGGAAAIRVSVLMLVGVVPLGAAVFNAVRAARSGREGGSGDLVVGLRGHLLALSAAQAVAVALFWSLGPTIFANYHNFGRAGTEALWATLMIALARWNTADRRLCAIVAVGGAGFALWTVWATTPVSGLVG